MEKLNEYQGWTGRLHEFRDNVKEKCRENSHGNVVQALIQRCLSTGPASDGEAGNEPDYSHIYR